MINNWKKYITFCTWSIAPRQLLACPGWSAVSGGTAAGRAAVADGACIAGTAGTVGTAGIAAESCWG